MNLTFAKGVRDTDDLDPVSQAIAVTAIGIIGAVLRFVTDTPAMKSS